MAASSVTRDWAEFDPNAYLDEYYGDIGSENLELLRFLAEAYQDVTPGSVMLDFGGGPTIYPLISAVHQVAEIHFSDYLEANLGEVRKWIAGDPRAFDWNAFIAQALEIEVGRTPSADEIETRAREIRKRVTRLMRCDASRQPPIEGEHRPYDVVLTNFCAESATCDQWEWLSFMMNILSLLKPGGRLIMSALKGATRYSVGARSFPAVDIAEQDLVDLLEEAGFDGKSIEIRSVAPDRPTRDYAGLMLATARKKAAPTERS